MSTQAKTLINPNIYDGDGPVHIKAAEGAKINYEYYAYKRTDVVDEKCRNVLLVAQAYVGPKDAKLERIVVAVRKQRDWKFRLTVEVAKVLRQPVGFGDPEVRQSLARFAMINRPEKAAAYVYYVLTPKEWEETVIDFNQLPEPVEKPTVKPTVKSGYKPATVHAESVQPVQAVATATERLNVVVDQQTQVQQSLKEMVIELTSIGFTTAEALALVRK